MSESEGGNGGHRGVIITVSVIVIITIVFIIIFNPECFRTTDFLSN